MHETGTSIAVTPSGAQQITYLYNVSACTSAARRRLFRIWTLAGAAVVAGLLGVALLADRVT